MIRACVPSHHVNLMPTSGSLCTLSSLPRKPHSNRVASLPLKDRVSPRHIASVWEQMASVPVSWAERWPLSAEEEWVQGGTALLLSICSCPPARLPSSARAEVLLSEELKGSPGERVLAILLLPGPHLCV